MPPRLISLPYEVLANIVSILNFEDVIHFARTCRQMQYLEREESICNIILQTKLPYCSEALEAHRNGGGYAPAMRRVAKRYDAFATAEPFSVAIVAFADAYLYYQGVLCYMLDDSIRILDLHRSGTAETVVNIPSLLRLFVLDTEENTTGSFEILYYSDSILTCLYSSTIPESSSWLIAFNVQTSKILLKDLLPSTEKIFVRHNSHYLYYGTHSELGDDGYKKWVIRGYGFKQRKWFENKIHLTEMVGSEMGSTICFEIYKDYFYALSNQTSFEVEEIDWTSFYHCVRFPIDSPCKETMQMTENKSMWRRQHQEGPIDDRWTSLRLEVDDRSGDLKVVEARREWHLDI